MTVALAAALTALGCGRSSPTDPERAVQLKYLFEVEYENHDPRFPPRWLGLVVEADGRVYGYERSGDVPGRCDHLWAWLLVDECGSRLTEGELQARYAAGRSQIGAIPPEELALRVQQQAGLVEGGPFGVPNIACNDTGTLSLASFRLESGRYAPVVLRLEGERPRQNLSPGASDLSSWLLEVAEQLSFIATWRAEVPECRPD